MQVSARARTSQEGRQSRPTSIPPTSIPPTSISHSDLPYSERAMAAAERADLVEWESEGERRQGPADRSSASGQTSADVGRENALGVSGQTPTSEETALRSRLRATSIWRAPILSTCTRRWCTESVRRACPREQRCRVGESTLSVRVCVDLGRGLRQAGAFAVLRTSASERASRIALRWLKWVCLDSQLDPASAHSQLRYLHHPHAADGSTV